jgi:hypothetical protein
LQCSSRSSLQQQQQQAAKNDTTITANLGDDGADICRVNAESRTKKQRDCATTTIELPQSYKMNG